MGLQEKKILFCERFEWIHSAIFLSTLNNADHCLCYQSLKKRNCIDHCYWMSAILSERFIADLISTLLERKQDAKATKSWNKSTQSLMTALSYLRRTCERAGFGAWLDKIHKVCSRKHDYEKKGITLLRLLCNVYLECKNLCIVPLGHKFSSYDLISPGVLIINT